MKKFTCSNCSKTASIEDAGSNWNVLGRRSGKQMFGCDCGHGVYVTLFSVKHASPDEVEDQKKQMRKAGLDPDEKIPTAGDIKKAYDEAPPGDLDFDVGDRFVDPRGTKGTVKEVGKGEDGKPLLQVQYDKGYGDMTIGLYPEEAKIRKIDK